MRVMRFGFVLEARTPIAHAAETIGNESIAMRRKVRQPDGRWADVPIVTGDTMRHQMREAVAYVTLDAAGLLEGARLSEGALRLLFAGGTLGGKGGGGSSAVQIGRYREIVEMFPPLGLFGGAAENRIVPGRLEVSDAVLICRESAHLLPAWAVEHAGAGSVPPAVWDNAPATPGRLARIAAVLGSCRTHVEEATRVRMDPTLSPEKRLLLADADRTRAEARLIESEGARAVKDEHRADEAKSSMMPRTHECVAMGSLFWWEVSARVHSDADRDCLLTTIGATLADLRVGGKRGTGHGHLRPVAATESGWTTPADRVAATNPGGLAREALDAYRARVSDNAARLRDWLAGVDA